MHLLLLDHQTNLFRLLQCLVVGSLLFLVFSGTTDTTLQCSFIVVLSCFWFGCNNAAKEIVKERPIYEQERNVVISPTAYAFSKFALLGITSTVQAVALTWFVKVYCDVSGGLGAWFILASCLALAGVGFGLAISAFSKSEEVAVAAIPILLIPQIILAGAIVTLQGANKVLGQTLTTCYWGYEGAIKIGNADWMTFESAFPIAIVLLHAMLSLAVACVGLKRRTFFFN